MGESWESGVNLQLSFVFIFSYVFRFFSCLFGELIEFFGVVSTWIQAVPIKNPTDHRIQLT